ncbi:MAG: T9SS type A sorting domain-containing protein [Bacteroidales bacterium]|nr:T9SS type A sorting domain-containing protein [Bacteroidales bacterium]
MKKAICILALSLMGVATFAQTVTLTFTGRNAANHYMQLDRVVITNQTKGWSETIYWPDTTLIMQNVTGIDESVANDGFGLSQNNPNPFTGTTDVNLTVADAGAVTLEIADGNGRIVGANNYSPLPTGTHQFRIILSAAGTYVMTARQNGKTSSIKMVCNGAGNGNQIEYTGTVGTNDYSPLPKFHTRGTTTNPFTFGDQMEYVGYATLNGTEIESPHITQAQDSSQMFALLFSEDLSLDGQPCPGTPTLTDIDGNVYNTVWLGAQCWMRENLRTTRFPNGDTITDATDIYEMIDATEPYLYAAYSSADSVAIYGYEYNWPAVMHQETSSDANPSGIQGICPTGWHVPSDAEWAQLISYVGCIPTFQCDGSSSDIAKSLAANTGWNSYDNSCSCCVGNHTNMNNATGFSALPILNSETPGPYLINYAFFWTTTSYNENNVWTYGIASNSTTILKWPRDLTYGVSVRCVRD